MRIVLALLATVLATSGGGEASTSERHATLEARLTPDQLTHKPADVRAGARGRFSATFWPLDRRHDRARIELSTRGLTGPALTAHLHAGPPGRSGPVLLTLCRNGRCNLSGTSFNAYPAGIVATVRLLGAYVDIHTKRNRRGELRGQIEVKR